MTKRKTPAEEFTLQRAFDLKTYKFSGINLARFMNSSG